MLISSVSGFEVDFAAGSYGAIKAALIHYAKGLSRQLVGKGIRVNCVSPGNTYFDGGIWQTIEKNMPDLFNSTLKVNPTGKFGTPEEVAHGVVFLSSPMASRISGTNLVIDLDERIFKEGGITVAAHRGLLTSCPGVGHFYLPHALPLNVDHPPPIASQWAPPSPPLRGGEGA